MNGYNRKKDCKVIFEEFGPNKSPDPGMGREGLAELLYSYGGDRGRSPGRSILPKQAIVADKLSSILTDFAQRRSRLLVIRRGSFPVDSGPASPKARPRKVNRSKST